MSEYDSGWNEAVEAAAKACEAFSAEQGRRADEKKNDAFTRTAFAMANGAQQCAAASRSLKRPPVPQEDNRKEKG